VVLVGLDAIHDEVVVEHPAFFEVSRQRRSLFCRGPQPIFERFVHMRRHSAKKAPTQGDDAKAALIVAPILKPDITNA